MSATSGRSDTDFDSVPSLDFELESGATADLSGSLVEAEIRASVSQQDAELARQEIARTRSKLESFENEKLSLREEISSLTENLEVHRNLEIKLVAQCRSLKDQLMSAHAKHRVVAKEFQEENTFLREKLKELQESSQLEIQALRARVERMESESSIQIEGLKSFAAQIADLEGQNRTLSEAKVAADEEIQAALSKNRELEGRVLELGEEVLSSSESSKANIQQLEQERDEWIDKFRRAELECTELRTAISEVSTASEQSEAEKRSVRELASRLQRRERQLQVHAELVRDRQNEVRRIAAELYHEMTAGQSLHPLKDYLQLTEFELKKHEAQLIKTPTISDDRPRIEAAVTRLLEQRDFLRGVIQSSEKELSERLHAIQVIARKSNSVVLPPPPPQAREAENASSRLAE